MAPRIMPVWVASRVRSFLQAEAQPPDININGAGCLIDLLFEFINSLNQETHSHPLDLIPPTHILEHCSTIPTGLHINKQNARDLANFIANPQTLEW